METSFTIFPAIDLRDGKVVRLQQGDPNRQTMYSDDPGLWARKWRDMGAQWLHIINLSGAFGEDESANLNALSTILQAGISVEFGGGVRTMQQIDNLCQMGVQRVFLGTAAMQQPLLAKQAIEKYGSDRIAGDIGAKSGKVMIKGWQEGIDLTVEEAGNQLFGHGIRWCVLTDVELDGVGKGVNIASAVRLQQQTGLHVVASGGVSSIDEVVQARDAGVAGIIIGRALYTGQINLQDCFRI